MRRLPIAYCRFSIGVTAIFVVALALSLVAVPLAAEAQQTGKVARVGTVSYTHLTLPTILLV